MNTESISRNPQHRQARIQFLDGFPQTELGRAQARNVSRTHAANSRWRLSAARNDLYYRQDTGIHQREHENNLSTIHRSQLPGNLLMALNWQQQSASSIASRQLVNTIVLPMPLPVSRIALLSDPEVKDILHQTHITLDQNFAPDVESGINGNTTMLMQTIVTDHCLLHCFAIGQLFRNKATKLHFSAREDQAIFCCYSEIVKSVNNRLCYQDTACDDINIMAVLTLAFHSMTPDREAEKSSAKEVPTPSQGPLKSLRHIQLYGGPICHAPLHREALVKMVETRGGLENLVWPGLAQNVS